MKRRQAVRAVLALAVGGELLSRAVFAQPRGRPWRIGRLGIGSPENAAAFIQAQDEALRELGLIEGRQIESVFRWARSLDVLPGLAAELVALPVDLILVSNNLVIAAAQHATSTIPIVMVVGVDPVRNGFINSFARPGRNITGLSNDTGPAMHGKMLGLLKELLPAAATVGVLVQQGLGHDRAAVDDAARLLKLHLHYPPGVGQPQDIEPAFEAMKGAGAQAVYVIGGAVLFQHRHAVVDLELRHRLPGIHFSSDWVRAGGLMGYGTDLRAQFRRSAWYVAQIVNGAKPAELPVELPARFEMAINLKTARAMGITIPQALLLQADEVIQ
jgi:putative tryptophan/tyrosine transport system substrate-binding protein